jgi:hypothetical protein
MSVRNSISVAAAAVAFIVVNVTPALAGIDAKVPVPGSLVLLASGVAGLIAAGWWTRKK